jgi:hypothetical protein
MQQLQQLLTTHAHEHNGYFDTPVVEGAFTHAVTEALGAEVMGAWGSRGIRKTQEGLGRTAGCGNLIDRVQKAYSCK